MLSSLTRLRRDKSLFSANDGNDAFCRNGKEAHKGASFSIVFLRVPLYVPISVALGTLQKLRETKLLWEEGNPPTIGIAHACVVMVQGAVDRCGAPLHSAHSALPRQISPQSVTQSEIADWIIFFYASGARANCKQVCKDTFLLHYLY